MKDKYLKINKKVDLIVKKVAKYMVDLNYKYIDDEIKRAYIYARDAHEGQYRNSGEPYISHPVEAVEMLLTIKPDIFTIQACLLHDVIEDTPKTEQDIKDVFGDEVAFLCVGMEKLSKVKYRGEQRTIGSLRKMFIAMAEDLRVIFIKLADRMHNMKTLKYHPQKEKRERIAIETLNIYAPIADRLGLFDFKNELEKECFRNLDYKNFKTLNRQLRELKSEINNFTKTAKIEIDSALKGKLDNYKIDFRVKSLFSIHKKLQKKGLSSPKELYDLFGLRVIVDTEADCYRALGIIHNMWTPLPKRFKDYIALPKPNGYKSLHTTVMGLLKSHRKQPTEIQIKTYKMKEYAEIGVAAHFEYKEKGSKISTDVNWVKELKETIDNLGDKDFVGSLKVDVFKNRIFIFTPKGDFINLPAGSTPVDFAYYVHTDLGDHITLAKVNDSVHPLDKELHNGDVVEIVVDKNKTPNPFRISFVKTVKAKNRIKNYLKKEDKDLHMQRGKDILSKYLEKAGIDPFDKDLSVLKVLDGVVYSKEDRLNILEQIGNFSITPSSIIKKIIKTNDLLKDSKKEVLKEVKKAIGKNHIEGTSYKQKIIIGGESDLPYKLAYCCRRQLSNDMVAHINSKGIINIHKRNCKTIKGVDKDRLLSAYIEGQDEESIIADIDLVFKNKIGVLKNMSSIIFSMGLDVDSISTTKISPTRMKINLKLKVLDYDYLMIDRFIERLKLFFKKVLVSSSISKIRKNDN